MKKILSFLLIFFVFIVFKPHQVLATACPAGVPSRGVGNANCDATIDLLDFEIWRQEFLKTETTPTFNADFIEDNTTDLKDFEIWRNTFTTTAPTSFTENTQNTPTPDTSLTEQQKEDLDVLKRNTLSSFFNAAIRYYAVHGGFPTNWTAPTPMPTGQYGNITNFPNMGDPTIMTTFVTPLVNAGELPANFYTTQGQYLTSISMSVQDSLILNCFKPQSLAFQQTDQNTKYTGITFSGLHSVSTDIVSGNPPIGSCKINGGLNDCYWCIY